MKKLTTLLFLVMLTAACSNKPFVIYNGCKGSWLRVRDGRGTLLLERLEYGKEGVPDLEGQAGRNVELIALGFELGSDRPLGSATTSRYIPNSNSGVITGPTQMQPWEVTSLSSSDSNGGCRP